MYRVGLPGWKLAAWFRVPLLVRVNVYRDNDANVYWATSPDLDGLTVEATTLDELRQEVSWAASELLSMMIHTPNPRAATELRIREPALCAA